MVRNKNDEKNTTVTAGEEDFVWKTAEGDLVLPNFGRAMSGSELRKHKNMDPLSILYYVLERDNSEEELAEIDKVLDHIPAIEMGNVISAWQEHARVTMGESSAS